MKFIVQIAGCLVAMLMVLPATAQTIERREVPSPTAPVGVRVFTNGTLQTLSGQRIYPTVSVPRGDGSTTYYYSNGMSVTVPASGAAPTGSYLSPSLGNSTIRTNTMPPVKDDWDPLRNQKSTLVR